MLNMDWSIYSNYRVIYKLDGVHRLIDSWDRRGQVEALTSTATVFAPARGDAAGQKLRGANAGVLLPAFAEF